MSGDVCFVNINHLFIKTFFLVLVLLIDENKQTKQISSFESGNTRPQGAQTDAPPRKYFRKRFEIKSFQTEKVFSELL